MFGKQSKNMEDKSTVFKDGLLFHEIFGFWPIDERYFSFKTRCKCYGIVIITILAVALHLTASKEHMDSIQRTEFVVEGTVCVVALFKFSPFILFRKRIHELMNLTDRMNRVRKISKEERDTTKFWGNIQSTVTKMWSICYYLLFTTYCIIPIIRNDGFPLKGHFPQMCYERPWYEITFLVITLVSLHRLHGVLSSNVLCCIFICQLCNHLQMVQDLIGNLEKIDRKQHFYVLYRHAISLDYGTAICSHFSPLFLLLMYSYLVIICSCGITAIQTENTLVFVKMVGFVILCIFEIFILCLVGETVTSESLKIADKLNSHAVSIFLDDTIMLKCINLSLLRAQKPLRLAVGNNGVLNLRYFSEIMNRIVSFFMIFKTLLDEGRI